MRGRDRSRATICSIGAGTTMPASAPAPIAASARTARSARSSAIKSPEGWLAEVEATGRGFASDESLSAAEAADEYLLMGLRLSEGIDLARLAAIDGRALDEARVGALARDGLHRPQRRAACRHAQRAARARPADRRARGLSSIGRGGGEGARRGVDHLRAAFAHFENGKAALGGAVGEQAEQPIDAGEAARPRELRRRVALARADLATATPQGSPRHRRGSRCGAAPRHRSWSSARRNCSSPSDRAPDTSRRPAPGRCRYWDNPIARCR